MAIAGPLLKCRRPDTDLLRGGINIAASDRALGTVSMSLIAKIRLTPR